MARRWGLGAAVALLAVILTAGLTAAQTGLPWRAHAPEIASDGGEEGGPTIRTTAIPAPPTASPLAEPHVTISVAFPNLPKLDRPTNMIELPTHWMLVSLQDGRIVTFPNDRSANTLTVVADLRNQVSRDGNEEGLLGMAVPPRVRPADVSLYDDVYLYYSAKPGERRTVVSEFRLGGDSHSPADMVINLASERVLVTIPQPYGNHKGGQLAFGPDGMLYIGIGDGGSGGDPNGNGQDLKKNWLGSILRLDVRHQGQPYAIPPDNPFASSPNGEKPETWAYGLRNPWRFSFDSDNGQLWAGDVGQDAYEEVDIIEPGTNYGWNIMEGFHCYKPSSGCNQQGLTLPVVEYPHSNGACSVTGGYVYRGNDVPSLRGWYVYGDYCTGTVWAIPATSKPGSRPIPVTLVAKGPQISSFAQDYYRAGAPPELYILSFDGKIYRFN